MNRMVLWSARKLCFVSCLILCASVDAHGNFHQKLPLWHGVGGAPWVRFTLDHRVSDEFNGNWLDHSKWDVHGLRNENTGCPGWNGVTNFPESQHSTYFTTSSVPFSAGAKVPPKERQYSVRDGGLHLRISKKPLSYFLAREYFCNAKTFACNHNASIPCFGTNFGGKPILKNSSDPTSYKFINHDKCKIEPYCIPHPKHVVGQRRIYQKWVAPNIVGKNAFRYGFFEVNVKVADASSVSAVWMYDQNMFPSYARYVVTRKGDVRLESPSKIRSRRWQEIDMLEAIHTKHFNRLYIPNTHVFSAYKGEFTQPTYTADRRKMGPIVIDDDVFRIGRNPRFSEHYPKRSNSWHMNPGAVKTLDSPWAENFHRVGLFWSPNELRFLVDGDEVYRCKNTLVHQRMFMVLSLSFNYFWARQAPNDSDAEKEFIIDYVRRWDVDMSIPGAPPSKLPLDYRMQTSFRSLGNTFRAVDGRFPMPDDNRTVELEEVKQYKNGRFEKRNVWKKATLPSDVVRSVERGPQKPVEVGESLLPDDHYHNWWYPRECWDNVTGRKQRADGREAQYLASRSDRNRKPEDNATYDPRNAITAYEDHDPNAAGAGWARANQWF